ncbi:uncharacterized protein LOC114266101 [Camellia sinensis]|uniref:uncharacterized protein LOC114266101 n=1 Tax=Camellia sinensis TaxID=4442 RepID=UPI0010359143|nr:uncharacterized protein LOC114266101 [Camellia sinensis]
MKNGFEESQCFYRRDSRYLRNGRRMQLQEDGEVTDDDDHTAAGPVNMVQISGGIKEVEVNEKAVAEVCQTYLTYRKKLRNPQDPQMSEVPQVLLEEEQVKYDVLAHLKKIPALLSVYDAVKMSPELRKSLIYALSKPEDFRKEIEGRNQEKATTCMAMVTFGDKDMCAEMTDHNQPLFITGLIHDVKISRILVDGGSANEQRPMGKIELRTKFRDIEESTEFLVIDVDTSYNALLGRPWMHNHHTVPSTYHQCIKYPLPSPKKEGTIVADNDPFGEVEAYYADARFYTKTSQRKEKDVKKSEDTPNVKDVLESTPVSTKRTFRYVPKSERKLGEKALAPINPILDLKGEFTLPLRKTECTYVEKYNKIVVPSKGKGSKPIIFHSLGDVEQKVKVEQMPEENISSFEKPTFSAKITQMLVKVGLDPGFIREVQYPTWLANIVPVKKKNGQIRVCIDFRDLNEACPKDDFLLPITELLVDATTGYETLSFMDGYSGYNQIRIAPEDEEMTAFRTSRGVFYYKVMPFGLKNAGATYQRAMTVIFGDMLHDTIECYVDDLVVKTREKENHVEDLRKIFEHLRRYKLKMNPLKCAFGVSSGKFLGFVVQNKGIEIDPTKIKAIAEMPPPRNLRELKGLQGRLAYIRRFISNLAGRCMPFSRLMKKGVPFEWDQQCQNAFNSIKEYLLKPPVLMSPIKGKPLLLYITALDGSLGALLAQHNEHRKENALYYLSRTLVGAEVNYSPIEKTCLALVFALQKLKHYVLEHEVKLISRADPVKYILSRPILSGKIAKWAVILQQFAIEYVPQRAVKGQALADFWAAHPIPDDSPLVTDLPDEEVMQVEIQKGWEMYFDGASRSPDGKKQENPKNNKVGIGIVFVTPDNAIITHSFALSEGCSDNEAEYEAVIAGLELALQIPIDELSMYGDSELVVKQLRGEYIVKKTSLIPYHERADQLLSQFRKTHIFHVKRRTNARADSLASLAASLTLPDSKTITITVGERRVLQPLKEVSDLVPILVVTMKGENEEDWREPFIAYLQHGRLPEDKVKRIEVKRRATKFVLWKDGTLYKRSLDGMFMRCIAKKCIQEFRVSRELVQNS